jgi:hypothetical protein
MAHEPIIPPEQAARLKALISGRPSSQGLERERSNSNRERVAPPVPKEQGNNPNRREHGERGTGKAQVESHERDRAIPQPPTSRPTVNPFTASSNILETIAQRFNSARELQKAGAWKQLQTDLMNASPFICPALIPYKDLIQIVADIEKEIKGSSSSQAGKSNEELLADFLSGKDDLGVKLPPPTQGGVDNGGTMTE